MRIFILLSTLFIAFLYAQSSVWKVSDGEHTMYLGGTIHVLDELDYPLPTEFDKAYAKADYLVFETDMAVLKDDSFAKAVLEGAVYHGDKTLRDVLSRESYMALKKYVVSEGYEMHVFERYKPGMVVISLTGMKLQQLGITQEGVDAYYSRRAEKEGKVQRHLESMKEQVAIITTMGEGVEDAMVLQTLRDMETLPALMKWITKAWREGDLKGLEKELLEPMLHDYPGAYDIIVKRRNDAWMRKLLPMIRQKETALVLVGTMHMVGQDGLLEQFRREGFEVEAF